MSFNVLIVDDSNSMRSVIKKVVSMSGFKMDGCYEAGNGREALEVLGRQWVDVIISDINMPEMNGFEFLQALERDFILKNIPVIVISTESREDRINKSFELGAKGFIKKPFKPEEVKKILHEVLGVNDEGTYDAGEGEELDF
ncbi:MAG: response regulator [Deltaproteobacteria bacterium]|nr:response regulator [Deltaproteobacteria bacterium]